MKRMCAATTAKDNTPCRYAAQKGSDFCGHHMPKTNEWEKALGLPPPTRKSVVGKLKTKLRCFPSSGGGGGGGGIIYIYFLGKERGLNLWKIGYTARDNIDERMLEWADTHDTRVVLKRAYTVAHSAALREKIIFYYLDDCRVHRYPAETDRSVMRTVVHTTGKVLFDVQEGEFVAKHKHTEWFHAPLTLVLNVVERVVEFEALQKTGIKLTI